MKKSDLKKIISEIVHRKITEGNKIVYGYAMKPEKGDDPSDPRLQLIGYGNMPKSFWKKKLERYAEELLKRVKDEDWRTAAYFMEKNGVFNSAINMMKEVSESNLKEASDAQSTDAAGSEQTSAQQKAADADPTIELKKKQLDLEKKKLEDLTNIVKKSESNIAKREETIKKANQKDQYTKDKATKKQAPIISKINTLQKDIEKKSDGEV